MDKRKEHHADIKEIINNNPIHFIMYAAGAGGEFLSSTISKYSDRYQFIRAKNELLVNRWNTWHSHLINYVCTIAALDGLKSNYNLDNIVTTTLDFLEKKDLNIDDIIYNADSAFKNHNNINLFRLHLSNNTFFTKENTFLLFLDKHWLEYAGILVHLKAHSQKLDNFDVLFDKVLKTGAGNNSLQEMIDYLKSSNDINLVTYGHLEIVKESKDSTGILDMNTFLRMSPGELFNQYKHITFKYYSDPSYFLKWQNRIRHTKNVIDYDKIFTKGYLEEIFNIQGDEFHNELIQWHEDNLALIRNSGIDWN
jgi:hypothetical protein